MGKTNIQWTDVSWNVARGCTKVDDDCRFCYMYRDSMSSTRYNPLEIVRTKTVFDLPLKIKEPSKIFTCSLTDFFHEAIDSYRHEAWDIIRRCPQHIFQILTKRPERIKQYLPEDWGEGWDNVWLGTSVGGQEAANERLHWLNHIYAKIKFVSVEPLHKPISLNSSLDQSIKHHAGGLKNCISWVIVGGESGNETGKYRYRPCELEWIENIVKECVDDNIPVFVKQLGTHLSRQLKMSDRHGGSISEFPTHLQIREFPKQLNTVNARQ